MNSVSVAHGPLAVYTGRSTNWPMIALSALIAIPLVLAPIAMPGPSSRVAIAVPIALVAIGIVAEIVTASSLRMSAGPNGVTVHWGLVGWPRSHYALADITKAEVIDLSAAWVSWGFWWTPRRTCCTVRSGPTLRLTLRTGRTVTITAPDPYAAVTAIDNARSN